MAAPSILVQNDLPELAARPLHALAIWHGGLSFYGGLAAGVIALWLFARRNGLVFGSLADIVALAPRRARRSDIWAASLPAIPMACRHRCRGRSRMPTQGSMAPLGGPLHPTQLYEAAALAILAGGLLAARRPLARFGPGALAAVYLVGLATIRFALFFYRDDVVVAGGLKVAQIVGIGIALLGVAWLARLRLRRSATFRRSEVLS